MTVKQAQEELATSPQLPEYGRGILQGARKGALPGAALGAFGSGMFSAGIAGADGMSDIDSLKFVLPNAGLGGTLGFAAGAGLGALKGGISTALERRRLQNAAAAQQAKEAGIVYDLTELIPGVSDLRGAKLLLHDAARNRADMNAVIAKLPHIADKMDVKEFFNFTDQQEQLGRSLTATGRAKLLGTGLAAAGAAGAAYGGKKLYDRYKEKQQAKQAGITDYIPGWTNLNRAHLAHIDAQYIANLNKTLNIPDVQDLVDNKRAAAIKELGIGGAKLLGTGLAVGGALYGAKKLYNHMTNNKAQEKVSAYMMKYAQEEAMSPKLPGYGRGALRGAAVGGLISGVPAASLGALWGHHWISGKNAPLGAAILGTPMALGGAAFGGLTGLGITALERRAIAKQEAAKVAGAAARASRAALGMGQTPAAKAEWRAIRGQTMSPSKINALVAAGDTDTLRRAAWNQDSAAEKALYYLEHPPSGVAQAIPSGAAIPSGGGVPTWAKVLGGTALAAGAAYGGKKLYDRYKANQQAKEAGIADMMKYAQEEAAQNLPGYGRNALRGAALGALASGVPLAAYGGIMGYGSSNSSAPMGAAILGGPAALLGAVGGGMAGLGITALERRRLRNMEAASQQAKEAGIADYIPGMSDLRYSKELAGSVARSRNSNVLQQYPNLIDSVNALEADSRRYAAIGGAKMLGTGLAAAGAAYGGKKLYDRYKAKQQAKQAAALPPSLGGEIGKHLLLAGAATLGGVAVQKGLSVASAALDKLEKPKNLARMMAVAPELRALDPQKVSLAYDSIAAISPQLVKDPLVGASVLKRHVQATDLGALRSAADLYRSPDPAVGSLLGSALTRAADKGYGSYEKKLEAFNNPKKP